MNKNIALKTSAVPSRSSFPRRLGALETMFWLIDEARPTQFAMTAEIAGSARAQQWQEALDAIGRQSALIWSRIVMDEAGMPWFEHVESGSIPLRVIEARSNDWPAYVSAELAHPFDASSPPLVRATLLHETDRCAFILCAHHSIADGMSLSMLIRDILRQIGGESVTRNPETAAMEQLVGVDQAASLGQPLQTETLPLLPATVPMPYPDMDAPAPRVDTMRLTAGMTADLRDRARQEGATVQGALSAAVTRAAAVLVPEWSKQRLRVLSPIDVRRRLLDGSDHLGLCVSAAVIQDCIGPFYDFWSRARHFSGELANVSTPDALRAGIGALRNNIAGVTAASDGLDLMMDAFGAEMLITNLGSLPVADQYGPLRLEALWGPAVTFGPEQEQSIGAVTVGGRLHLLHSSWSSAGGLLDLTAGILAAALRNNDGALS